MTVINVTNATLKGSVKGPTFTGNVDGATFTGDVTYTDTTVPPVEPPSSDKGLITDFNAANGSRIKIGGVPGSVQNGNKSWSLKNPDPYTLRFEVHSGDRWTSPGYSDPTTAERSEVGVDHFVNAGVAMNISHGLMIEPGSKSTSIWCTLCQIKQLNGSGPPPMSLELTGDKMVVVVRANANTEQLRTAIGTVERGHKYAMKIEIKMGSNGYCRVWRDGGQVINFTGTIFGSNDQYYWKQGLYRNEAPETLAANYSNLYITI